MVCNFSRLKSLFYLVFHEKNLINLLRNFFLVPSLPPQRVQSYNTSSTSVNVTWNQVPFGFVHGLLRGYRVFYSTTQHHQATVKHAVVPAGQRYVHLTGLNKFTNYTIQVAAFTRKGYGELSPGVTVSTDEDGMTNFNITCLL